MTEPFDVLVVGAGPAAISAAWPMAEAGLRIGIADAGLPEAVTLQRPQRSLYERRTMALGISESGKVGDAGLSPRVRLMANHAATPAYLSANGIACRDFSAVAGLALGGLSTVWGASVARFGDDDMAGWPIAPSDLDAGYRAVAERIGISGSEDDAMAQVLGNGLPMDPALTPTGAAAELLTRYDSRRPAGLLLGKTRNAVITRDRPPRRGCALDKSCILGCGIGAVYSAADDAARLCRTGDVTLMDGLLVERLEQSDGQWIVRGRDRRSGAGGWAHRARDVVVAAGALASTRLIMELRGNYEKPIALANAPAATLAFLTPSRIGGPLSKTGYGMAQLAYQITPERDPLFGLLYEADSFFASDLADASPLSRRGTGHVLKALMPGLMVGMLYFPGHYSRNSLRLDRSGLLQVSGGVRDDFAAATRRAFRRIRRSFARMGTWLLPFVSSPLAPGAEVHYGCTLPMGRDTSEYGEVLGFKGLHVVDGSVLPTMPAKSHTLTAMANAHRIGVRLAAGRGGGVA